MGEKAIEAPNQPQARGQGPQGPPKKMKMTVEWAENAYAEKGKVLEKTVFEPFVGFDGSVQSSIAMAVVLESRPGFHQVRMIPHTFIKSFTIEEMADLKAVGKS